MPAVRLFGRRTLTGGDDLQPGAVATILVRLVQITFLITPLLVHSLRTASKYGWGRTDDGFDDDDDYSERECDDGTRSGSAHPVLITCYVSASLLFCVGSLVMECVLYRASSVGTPTEPHLRLPLVARLIEIKLVPGAVFNLIVFSIGVAAASTTRRYYVCRGNVGGDDGGEWEQRGSYGGGGGDGDGDAHYGFYNDFFNDDWFVEINGDASRGTTGGEGNSFASRSFITAVPPYWWACLVLLLTSQAAEGLMSILALCRVLSIRRERDTHLSRSPGGRIAIPAPGERSESVDITDEESIVGDFIYQHLHHEGRYGPVEEMWSKRCRLCCRASSVATCFLFGGRNMDSASGADFGHIARVLADYFEDGGILDVVPSDVAAALMMLRRVQKQREVEARQALLERKSLQSAGSSGGRGGGIGVGESSSTSLSAGCNSVDQQEAKGESSLLATGSRPGSSAKMAEKTGTRPILGVGESSAMDLAFADSSGSGDGTNSDLDGHPNGSKTNAPDASKLPSSSLPPRGDILEPTTGGGESGDVSDRHLLALSPNSALMYRLHQTSSRFWYDCINRTLLSREDEVDRSVIAEGARFSRHAIAIYTWKLYVYMYPVTGLCSLGCFPRCRAATAAAAASCKLCCEQRRRRGWWRRRPPQPERGEHGGERDGDGAGTGMTAILGAAAENLAGAVVDETCCLNGAGDGPDKSMERSVEGDNCCRLHETALLRQAGLDECDLVYARFDNGFRETPYCIVIDRRWQSIVLSIRGSLSLEDCVVDVLVDPEPLEGIGREWGFDGEGEYCHSGVLSRVEWISEDLQRHALLERLLLDDESPYSGYSLRIVGHSLGAGCAIILSLMLRRKYPSLRCLCYSPPGGLLSWNLATNCKDFVTSFVLDTELVPRLSVESMEHLRNELLELILRIKVPKIKVASAFVLPDFTNPHGRDLPAANNSMLYPKESIPWDTEFARQLEEFKSIQRERKEHRGLLSSVSLYPPGKIVHLVKTSEHRSCSNGMLKCLSCGTSNAGSKYTPIWVNNDDLNEIIVSPTMGTDHFPNRVCLELENVANDFGLDTTLGSGEERSAIAFIPGHHNL